MTVSSTSSRTVYQGNGSTTAFPFAFKVSQAADLVVIYTDATGTDYTLSPMQYAATGFGLDAGGTVTYAPNGGPIATGTTLTIYRSVAPTQPTSISNQGAMWPQVIEAALDRGVMVAQGFLDTAARAVQIPVTDNTTLDPLPSAADRAGKFFGWDHNGQPVAANSLGANRGVWQTGRSYNFGDLVSDGANGAGTSNVYSCAVPHGSGAWATDLAAGDWTLLIDVQAIDLLATYYTGSATSLTIGIGTQSFTVGAGLPFQAGQFVEVMKVGATGNYMVGPIDSYDPATGAMVMNATATGGSGTAANWSVVLSGAPGSVASGALLSTNNLSDVASVASARTNLGLGNNGPTTQTFTSGTSATYTTPAGVKWIKVRMVGGGGGGGGVGASAGANGSNGSTTSFSSVNAAGGSGGAGNTGVNNAVAGGAAGSGGTGTATLRLPGNAGAGGVYTGSNSLAGFGGGSVFGGSPAGGAGGSGNGAAGGTNTGAGGAGAAGTGSTTVAAGGGGSGEYVELIIANPSATYTYTVGGGGAGGTGTGSATATGGAGATGLITVEEHYSY